jgi:hypothetical protein
VSAGSALWLALGAAATLLAVAGEARPRRLPRLADLAHWWMASWVGRIALLAAWAEAGFHVFTQRP